jgi:hypothetical protein
MRRQAPCHQKELGKTGRASLQATGTASRIGGDRTCVEEAFRLLVGSSDPLDAVHRGL